MRKAYRNMCLLVMLVGCFMSLKAYSQKTGADSLMELLHSAASDTEKVNVLNKIAGFYGINGHIDSGFKYGFQALKLAIASGSAGHLADTKLNIALLFQGNGQTDSAVKYAEQAAKYYQTKEKQKKLLYVYKNIAEMYENTQEYITAISYYNEMINVAIVLNDTGDIHLGYRSIGGIYDENDEYGLGLDYYKKALNSSLKYKNYLNASKDYVDIGNIQARQGIFPPALQAYLNALDVNTAHVKSNKNQAIIYIDIGNIYNMQHDTLQAMKYYRNALQQLQGLKDTLEMGVLLGDIGNMYMDGGDYKRAEVYQKEALKMILSSKNKAYLSLCYTNLGEFYQQTNQYAQSLQYYNKALQMQEESDDWEGQTYTLSGLSKLYSKMGDYKDAEKAGLGGFEIAKNTNLIREKKDLGKILSELYEKINQPAKALYYYKQYISAKDTLENEEISKKMIRTELNYEYEQKQQAQKLEDEKKDALTAEKANHERRIRNLYLAGLVLVFLLTILLLRNFIRVRKANSIITEQKKEVEEQKSIVEQKNRDITDSINYAKRIQQAMLPTVQAWNNFFRKSFIYYKPKDIVSGDFYWCMAMGNDVILAVADCTGHGVPGAFMSMLGISSLNKIVGEQGIRQPGQVLNMLRDEIIKSLNPEGTLEEVKDGMDMTLCYIHKEAGILEYASANNPLWIIRRAGNGYQLIESETDKMPVGKYLEDGRQFKSYHIEIKNGDRVYLLTDGYGDQFGGEKGKKFKYRHLQDMLLSWQDKPLDEQKVLFEQTMVEWKGNLEQVDDMLVAGIEIV